MNFLALRLGSPDWWHDPHALMGLTFGGLHLAASVYLYYTESRSSPP
jgi:hypothetical protein